MEYINGTTLQDFLRKSRSEHHYKNLHGASQSLSSRDLTSFAYQVSSYIFSYLYGFWHFNFQNGKVTVDCKFIFSLNSISLIFTLLTWKIHFYHLSRYTKTVFKSHKLRQIWFQSTIFEFLENYLQINLICCFCYDSNDFLTLTKNLRQINQNRTSFLTLKYTFSNTYNEFETLSTSKSLLK